jgi:hypothetical protein
MGMTEIFRVARIAGAAITPDRARIDLEFSNADGDGLTLRLPIERVAQLIAVSSSLAGEAQGSGFRLQNALIAERVAIGPSDDPEMLMMLLSLREGMDLRVGFPADQAPDA